MSTKKFIHLFVCTQPLTFCKRTLTGSIDQSQTEQAVPPDLRLTLSQTSPDFYESAVEVFRKHCGKRRNCS